MKINLMKATAYLLLVIVILNLVLFSFGLINPLGFWFILAICAIGAYKAVPAVKKQN